MKTKKKMRCPYCGADMNHHAEKIDLSALETDRESVDEDFDGTIVEFHSCPACGKTASRPAAQKESLR